MKAVQFFFLALMIAVTACKKSKPIEDTVAPGKVKSIQESYQGKDNRYFLDYNNKGQLNVYESDDKKLQVRYEYDGDKPQKLFYKLDTVRYELSFSYNSSGITERGLMTTRWKSGKLKEDSILITKNDDGLSLSFFNGVYACTVKNGNLISAEFRTWFFKRKLTVTYGANQANVYASNLVFPTDELFNPLFPSDSRYAIIVHMLLSAFSKNDVLSVESEMYTRTFNYARDAAGKTSSVTIQVNRKSDNGPQFIGSKLIRYYY